MNLFIFGLFPEKIRVFIYSVANEGILDQWKFIWIRAGREYPTLARCQCKGITGITTIYYFHQDHIAVCRPMDCVVLSMLVLFPQRYFEPLKL